MGYLPVSVKPRSKTQINLKGDLNIPGLTDRVKLGDLAVATRQLSSMVDSGLSLVRSLSVMVSQVENKQLAKVFNEVRLDAEQGLPFSQALAKHTYDARWLRRSSSFRHLSNATPSVIFPSFTILASP